MQFSEVKTKIDTLAGDISSLRARVAELIPVVTTIGDSLDALPSVYGKIIGVVDAAANGSSDPALLTAKAEKDLLDAEYLAVKAQVAGVLTALA